jgi:hypothetical protein
VGVDRGDLGLEPVRAHAVRPPKDAVALGDAVAVPQGAVLVLEQDQAPVGGDPREAPRIVEEHQREQAQRLGLVRHQDGEQLREADRLLAEISADEPPGRRPDVALVEDEVEHGEDRIQPLGQEVLRRDAEGDASVADLALRADEALAHGGFRYEEGTGDLGRGQAGYRAQGQGHLGVSCEGRVAASEDQTESLVGHRFVVVFLGRELGESLEDLGFARQRLLAADPVDRAVAGCGGEPRRGVVRRAISGPSLDGGGECVLEGVLGKFEVAEDADQDREDAAPLLADDSFELCQCSTTGRTSMAPPVRATGILAATSIASSRSSASIR